MWKKNIAKLLVFAMLLSMLPIAALATTDTGAGSNGEGANESGYSYSVNVDTAVNGSVTTNATNNKATKGTSVTVTATPNEGFEIEKITVKQGTTEVATSTTTTCTFTMPEGDVTVSATFKAKEAAAIKVTMDPTSKALEFGATLKLTATVENDKDNAGVTWTTTKGDNNAYVVLGDTANALEMTVTAGNIKGTATVTATSKADSTKSATCTITMDENIVAVTGLTVTPETLNLKPEETGKLTAKVAPENATNQTVTWEVDDPKIATISAQTGKEITVTAVAAGTAKVTASCGTFTKTCVVTVNSTEVKVESITLDKESLKLTVGEDETLTATVKPDNATDKTVTWTSGDEKIATVDENGKVKAIAVGETVITAKAGDKEAKCPVTVAAKEIVSTTTVSDVKTENGVTTATIDEGVADGAITKALNDAAKETDPVATVVVELKVAAEGETEVKAMEIPASMFTKMNEVNGNEETPDMKVSVAYTNGTALTLDQTAIASIAGEASTDAVITMSLDSKAEADVKTDEKPSSNLVEKIHAIFEAVIRINSNPIKNWKGGSNITLSVGKPSKDFKKTDKTRVYLDGKLASDAVIDDEGDGLDITVPHLTMVALAEAKESSSGDNNNNNGGSSGGGGGSSKPAIKPGTDTNKPSTPTTTPGGGVAGFNDVATSAWYADSVKYVVDKGLFGGVGNGNFAPNANMTRAMMWTVLARYMGVNTNTGSNWYEAARTWAMAQNISDGTMADGNVTREQFVTMLWRLSGEPAVETSASFTDNGSISGYAKTAVDWAVAQGILNGYNDGSFRPQGSATRAEVAKMLTVFCQNADNAEPTESETESEA